MTGQPLFDPNGPRREGVEWRSATVQGVDVERRLITLRVIPYNQETGPVEYRGKLVNEIIESDAFRGIEARKDHVTANRDHDYGRTFGMAVEYRHDDPSGLIADVYAAETALGDETLELAKRGILKASAGMVVRRSDEVVRNGLRRVKRGYLDHIALVPNPQYRGTDVLAVRQAQQAGEVVDPPTPRLDAIQAWLDARAK